MNPTQNGRAPENAAQTLCPAQSEALEQLLHFLQLGSVAVLHGSVGSGKSTVLRALQARTGGTLLTMGDFFDALQSRDPVALEETFATLVGSALQKSDLVIVDDLHLLSSVVGGCAMFYNRQKLLDVPLMTLATYATQSGKRLVFAHEGAAPSPLEQRAWAASIDKFSPRDYEALCRAFLPDATFDAEKVHRFAPKLNAHQIAGACAWLREGSERDTETLIDYLRSQQMLSNVALSEVRDVKLRDLKGVDDVIASLEANIILPLENDALASEMQLRPKRGVLLAGPPGTGKTTVGRALAHRLRSKFFLIDGTFIAGTRDFYKRIRDVFEAAKANAPSVIFIDDGDAIFEGGEEQGLYRYLLTMLDGLESQSAGRVCVVMTAMDVGDLPPALVRSGRIELWLETRLPDESARLSILQACSSKLPESVGTVDAAQLAQATDDMTGADLNRLIEDGKLLMAYEKATGQPPRDATDYFLSAIETVRSNKQRYAEAETRARAKAQLKSGKAFPFPFDFSAIEDDD